MSDEADAPSAAGPPDEDRAAPPSLAPAPGALRDMAGIAADLSLDTHGVAAPLVVTGEYQAAALVHDPLPRTIRRVALPAVASNLLMTLFGSVDAYWVGTRVGSAGLAAVSTSVFWIWGAISLAELVSIGLTAVAARRHGERRPDRAAEAVGQALVLALVFGVTVAAVGLLVLDDLFAMMHTPPEVTALGRRYLGAYLVGAPLIFAFFAVDAAFRAAGDTRTPFVLLASSVALTLVLDPILILGLGPAPELGVAGAGVATVLTRGAAGLLGLTILVRRRMIRFGSVELPTLRAIARIGLPASATGVTFSLIYVVLTRTTTQFGTPALAALGIGHRVESWLYMIGLGGGAAAAAIVGQNLGAGRADRAERAGWLAVAYTSVPGVAMCLAAALVPEALASLFTDDPLVIAESARYLRIGAIAQLVLCAEIVLEGALGGAGDTVPPMLTSTALTLSRIPIAVWAALHWGTDGIWWTISLTALARGLAMMAIWRWGPWRRRSV